MPVKEKIDRNKTVVELRLKGETFTAIGNELNIDRTTCAKIFYRWLRRQKR